ncbi:MAG: hypothetical protein DRJ42_05590 [Deltaproteobacteria bacterium]|nr:MAG: hypothetical protein DRJ42_05590 [Deltaproteobacteria bacterium]
MRLGLTAHQALVLAVLVGSSLGVHAGCGAEAPETESEADGRDNRATSGDEVTGRNAAPSTTPSPAEQRVIDDLARAAERIRGLEFTVPVQVSVQDQAAIVHYLTSELEEEDLELSHDVYFGLGLIPRDLDIRDLLERVLGEQVVGYYDPEVDRLVIRDDVMRALGRGDTREGIDESRATIVHELVHALQDQRLGLGDRFEEDDRDTDPEAAFHAVIEGDATLAMIGYVMESQGARLEMVTARPDLLAQLLSGAAPMSDDELGTAPAILRVTLLSSYVDGLVFAARLHGIGGFDAVNDANRTPPVSTEQILHPERYLRGELPDEVTLPAFSHLEDAGLAPIEEDTLGELEMKVYLGQLEETGVLPAAADGWSGDRLRVYRQVDDGNGDAGAAACIWFTAWDDVAEAREAEAAAKRIVEAAPRAEQRRHRVERIGRGMLIVRHLDQSLHSPIREAFRAFAHGLPGSPPTR